MQCYRVKQGVEKGSMKSFYDSLAFAGWIVYNFHTQNLWFKSASTSWASSVINTTLQDTGIYNSLTKNHCIHVICTCTCSASKLDQPQILYNASGKSRGGSMEPMEPLFWRNETARFSSRSSNFCNFTPRIHQTERSQQVRNQKFSWGGGACPQTHPIHT